MLAGLIGISDPLREGVREAVEAALGAGIRVVMVTGDHSRTAAAVSREAGISPAPVVLTGDQLQHQLAAGERGFLADLAAVSRATPAQKVLLVEALRESRGIVAVTGDGVNDVPALKAADVGIAMGLRGTRSAREVASIILLDDNFSTIVRAIAEGRQLFRNLVRSFAFLLMVHIPLVSTAALVPLLGYPLLYLPIHVVILELMIHPAAILGFQRRAGDGLERESDRQRRFFTVRQGVAIAATGTLVALGVAGLFVGAIERGETVEHARSLAIVALTVALVVMFAILSRLRARSAWFIAVGAMLVALAVAVPRLAELMHLDLLGVREWVLPAAVGAMTAATGALFSAIGPGVRDAAHSPREG